MSRRFVLILISLLGLHLSPSALRASQNAQEARQDRKARPAPDAPAQIETPPASKEKPTPAANPASTAHPSQPEAARPRSLLSPKRDRHQSTAATYIVNTARNCAFPLIIRAYASAAFTSGNFSIIGLTPVISAKRSVSSESVGMPDAHP